MLNAKHFLFELQPANVALELGPNDLDPVIDLVRMSVFNVFFQTFLALEFGRANLAVNDLVNGFKVRPQTGQGNEGRIAIVALDNVDPVNFVHVLHDVDPEFGGMLAKVTFVLFSLLFINRVIFKGHSVINILNDI